MIPYERNIPRKRNLVIVRAGDNSLHPGWLAPDVDRNWDLLISYYGDNPDRYRNDGFRQINCKGTEYPAFYKLLSSGEVDWRFYDRIWFPDDDLDTDGRSINRFFDVCAEFGLELAQPSLDRRSYASYPFTIHDPRYRLRWTNFVEVMAPCFSRQALERCLETFNESQSSYGLDFLWSGLVGGVRSMAIVDDATICHTRPIGGPLYDLLAKMGVDIEAEKNACLAKLGGRRFVPELHAGVLRDGSVRSFQVGGSDLFQILYWLSRGELALAHSIRDRMRGDGARSLKTFFVDQIFSALNYPQRVLSPHLPRAALSEKNGSAKT